MFNAKTFLRQAALALALAGSSLAALAGPLSFHVKVDTTGRADAGYLDLQLGALMDAAPVTVTISNFTGAFGNIDAQDGVSFNPNGSVTLANGPGIGSYLSYEVMFGGAFGFDLLFSDDYSGASGGDGSTLTVGLFDTGVTSYGSVDGIDGVIARFELTPGVGIDAAADAGFATVGALQADVPEPTDWSLMATGLVLLGLTLQRRKLG